MASHAFEHHTGELKVRLEAKTLGELFTEAARALADVFGVGAAEPPGPWQRVTLTGRDHEALLVAWLNELVARVELEGRLYRETIIHDLTSTRLDASMRAVPFQETRTAVKAATFHGLHITSTPTGVSATVILDV